MLSLCGLLGVAWMVGAAPAGEPDVDVSKELEAAAGELVQALGPATGVRAKKDADLSRQGRLDAPTNLEAKVDNLVIKRFPVVALTLQVVKPAASGAGTGVTKNAKIVVTPWYRTDGSRVVLDDPQTVINAGAYYLKKGDKIAVRLGTQKNGYWEAEYIERK